MQDNGPSRQFTHRQIDAIYTAHCDALTTFVPTSSRGVDKKLGLKTPPWKELPPCIKASHMLTSFPKIINNDSPFEGLRKDKNVYFDL